MSIIKFLRKGLNFGLLFFSLWSFFGAVVKAEEITIAIDPGHGGENLGADYQRDDGRSFVEKDMTLITALSMKEELERFEGVRVVMTREADVERDISLEDRVKTAQEQGADFLVCLHYNMSVSHILYGSEVWVPSAGELYSKGASLAAEFREEFSSMGLFDRGTKTRLNDKGSDYYGILRHAALRKVPTILVEHCHLDHNQDRSFYETEEALKEFGRRDAQAVARYFGLVSSEMGVDYSSYQREEFPAVNAVMAPDLTPPDVCELTLLDFNKRTGEITAQLTAKDADSGILYYTYSYDGGKSWESLQEWGDGNCRNLSVTVENGTTPEVIARVYNGYDLNTESNRIRLPEYFSEPSEAASEAKPVMGTDQIIISGAAQESGKDYRIVYAGIVLAAAITALLLFLGLFYRMAAARRKKNRKIHQPKSRKP